MFPDDPLEAAAPPAYSESQTAVPLNVNVRQLLVVDLLKATGFMDTAVVSDVGNPGAIQTTSAASKVDELEYPLRPPGGRSSGSGFQ